MPTTLYLVRHAEGFHNLARDTSIRDPHLTPLGLTQSRYLGVNFPDRDKITHIVASPMKRTLNTAYYAFQDLIDGPKGTNQIIANPDLQECSEQPCDVGSAPEALVREFGAIADLGLVVEGWNRKEPGSKYAADYDALSLRARAARRWLRDLGNSREDAVIVVVTHGDFIHMLEDKDAPLWNNTECRRYDFLFTGNDDKDASIIENGFRHHGFPK